MAYTVEGKNPTELPELAEIENEVGRSNFFRAMAQHPNGIMDFYRFMKIVMGPGTVDNRAKEMAYIAVSSINECEYCLTHHETKGLAAGISAVEIQSIKAENDQSFTPRERAILRFSRELSRNAAIEDTTKHEMQNNLSPEQFAEIAQVVALANFTNRFNNGLNVALEK